MYSTVTKNVEQRIRTMLADNMSVEEIAEVLKVDPIIVQFIDHQWVLEELLKQSPDEVKTIDDLIADTKKSDIEYGKTIENERKQLAILLSRFDVPVNQIHLVTKLSIYPIRSIIEQQRKAEQVLEESCTLPKTIVTRIIMSIFINHYNAVNNVIDDMMTSIESEISEYAELNKIIVAWLRTKEEIKNSRLEQALDFLKDSTQHIKDLDLDHRYLCLGTLFPIAHYLRLNNYRQKSGIITKRKKKASYICEADCKVPTCRCHYAYFVPGKDTCPYCDLEKLMDSVIAKNAAKEVQTTDKKAEESTSLKEQPTKKQPSARISAKPLNTIGLEKKTSSANLRNKKAATRANSDKPSDSQGVTANQ